MHLVIDGYGGDYQGLQDEALIYRFLDEYPSRIGMTKIAPPSVSRYVGGEPEDWGVSGFVLIAESHISIHTFPERGEVWVDIFSCKEFDAGKALQEITSIFSLASTRVWMLERGLEYAEHRQAHRLVTAVRTHSRESL